jgi:gamma-glutamylcyclotransferase (GGCT)/AIG2-like uncharacterized protein YtfP
MLLDYGLLFNKRSQKDGSGKANVEPHPGRNVWGVLYTISDADLHTLDNGEGRGYYRTKLPVRTADARITEAWVYLASRLVTTVL